MSIRYSVHINYKYFSISYCANAPTLVSYASIHCTGARFNNIKKITTGHARYHMKHYETTWHAEK